MEVFNILIMCVQQGRHTVKHHFFYLFTCKLLPLLLVYLQTFWRLLNNIHILHLQSLHYLLSGKHLPHLIILDFLLIHILQFLYVSPRLQLFIYVMLYVSPECLLQYQWVLVFSILIIKVHLFQSLDLSRTHRV